MAVLHPMYNQKPSDNNDNKSQTEIDNNPNSQPQPHVRADDKNTFTAGVPLLVIQNDTANEDDSKLPNMLSTTTIHPVPSTHGSSTTDGDGSSSSTGEGDGVSSLATEDTTPMTSSLHGGFNNGNNGNRCGEGIFIDTDGIAKVLMGNGIDADGKKKVNGTFLTLLTKPDYIQGLLVLHAGLRACHSIYPMNVMATSQLDEASRQVVREAGIGIIDVESLRPMTGTKTMPGFERFGDTWTKLRAFELVQFEKIVLLDCDMLLFQNMDDLFEVDLVGPALASGIDSKDLQGEEWIAAVHACTCNPLKIASYPKDWVPENCGYTGLTASTYQNPTPASSTPRTHNLLNGGLLVLHPSISAMSRICHFLATSPLIPTYKFPDQDLLSAVYEGRWRSLPYVYNALKTLRRIHKGLWRDEDVRCMHFILDKPWDALPNTSWPSSGTDYSEVHGWWWDKYIPILEEMKGREGSNWELVDKYVI